MSTRTTTPPTGAGLAPLDPRRIVTASYQLAGGGFLLVFDLPILGILFDLGGALLVVLGAATLADVVRTGPRAARLRLASRLAVVVGTVTTLLVLATLARWLGADLPVHEASLLVAALATTQSVLGVVGTLLVTTAMAAELRDRDADRSVAAWTVALTATVVVHAPIAVTAILAAVFGGEARVDGALGILVFLVGVTPFVLLGRAGAVTDRELSTTVPEPLATR